MTFSLRWADRVRKNLSRKLRVESLESRAMLSCSTGDAPDDVVDLGPMICLSGSQGFESDGDPQAISWLVEPDTAELDSLVVSLFRGSRLLSWTTSSAGTFYFDNQPMGDFTIEVVATDLEGNSSLDSREVTVYDDDRVAPLIVLSGSEAEQTLDESQIFEWAASDDSGLSAVVVTVTKDGQVIYSSDEVSGTYEFDDQGEGTYQLNVLAIDDDSDWIGDSLQATATRSVTVVPGESAPTIVVSGSSGDQLDSEQQLFSWEITDVNGDLDSSIVSILHDGVEVATSTDSMGQFTFDGLGLGLFTMLVTAEDSLGQQSTAERTVVVTDDDTIGPEISISGSSGTEMPEQEQAFQWTVSDLSGLSQVAVSVTHDGVLIFNTTDESGSFVFDDLRLGQFMIEVTADDADDDWSEDATSSVATQSVTVVANPETMLRVTSVTENVSGFTVELSRAIKTEEINLYGEMADLVVTGPEGILDGSLIIGADGKRVDWIKSGGPLSAGEYSIMVRSGADAFVDLDKGLLDGNADGIAGDDFTTTLTIEPAAGVVLGIPDFTRGPGQEVDILSSGIGLPVVIEQAEGVTGVDFTINYDPSQLEIGAVLQAQMLPANWGVLSNLNSPSFVPGTLQISIFGVQPLADAATNLVSLTASIPDTAEFGATRIITIDGISVNTGQMVAAADRAVLQISYLGDVDGDRLHTGFDASLIGRAVVQSDNGFAAFKNVAPLIIGGVSGSPELNGLDASWVARKSVQFEQPEVPDIPELGPLVQEPLSPDVVDSLLSLDDDSLGDVG